MPEPPLRNAGDDRPHDLEQDARIPGLLHTIIMCTRIPLAVLAGYPADAIPLPRSLGGKSAIRQKGIHSRRYRGGPCSSFPPGLFAMFPGVAGKLQACTGTLISPGLPASIA